MEIVWDPGRANPRQREFFASRALYTAYGGAKGGGKTWAVRVKAIGGAITHPGIRILIMRRTYPELEENHIRPCLAMTPPQIASYNKASRIMTFRNGSVIRFGHWAGEQSEREYQGQEFDWIFLDEATQFTQRTFAFLGGCLRGVNGHPKRMYLTCNPGGVGHRWVKRLFIDRDYVTGSANPEEDERPEDYVFIPATVEDNKALLESSPGYLRMLSSMPEDLRRAYRYGDWNALGGNYFSELRRDLHTVRPFPIPGHWRRYRAIDYGLDMLAAIWAAVDEQGRSYIYRELKAPGLIVSQAAERIRLLTGREEITATFAPPDLWSRQKDTGSTIADLFLRGGVPLLRAENDRAAGHLCIKDCLAPMEDGKPGLLLFDTCSQLFRDMAEIQASPVNPSDCATEPHNLTHTVDALRYYCVSRRLPAPAPCAPGDRESREGEATQSYIYYN